MDPVLVVVLVAGIAGACLAVYVWLKGSLPPNASDDYDSLESHPYSSDAREPQVSTSQDWRIEGWLKQLVERRFSDIQKDIKDLRDEQRKLWLAVETLRNLRDEPPLGNRSPTPQGGKERLTEPQGVRFGRLSTVAPMAPAPGSDSPDARAAQIKRMVDDYCSRTISMNKLITDAKRWQLVWGAVNITEMQLERNRPAALMAFGASDGEAFVVVGEDCAYNAMAHALFFERLTAPEGQPVFVRTAAVVALNADGRIEPRQNGILEIRG